MSSELQYEFHAVARRDEIPDGEGRAFDVGSRRIAIFNQGNEYHAIDDACPHMGASLAEGHLESHVITCPLHAWRFDIRDGTWCDNRRVKIDAFPVKLSGDQILVGVPASGEDH